MEPSVDIAIPRSAVSGSDYLQIGTYGGNSSQNVDGQGIYGYNWWFNPQKKAFSNLPEDAIISTGYNGACSIIIPSLDLVIVGYGPGWENHKPGNHNSEFNLSLEKLINSISIK
jgi:hypothetical protein